MPKSGWCQQQCPCEGSRYEGHRPHVSVTIAVQTLGVTPRRKAPAVTLYPCPACLEKLHQREGRKLRRALAEAVRERAALLAPASKGRH